MNTSEHTILAAEDNPDEALLLERACRKANLHNPLHVARDGQEVIDYLMHQGNFSDAMRYPLPALLLLDLKMPRKNGFEVLEWLRQQPGLRRLIVVVLTSSNQVADVNRAYDLGSNSYLVKPAGFETLIEMMKDVNHYWLELNERPDLKDNPRGTPASGQSVVA